MWLDKENSSDLSTADQPSLAPSQPAKTKAHLTESAHRWQDLIERIRPFYGHTLMEDVFDRFRRHQNATFFPVCDHKRRPIGMLREVNLKRYVYSAYGRELLRRKRLDDREEDFLSVCPMIDFEDSMEAILDHFKNEDVVEGFIVKKHGHYAGFLSMKSILLLAHQRELELIEMHSRQLDEQRSQAEERHKKAEKFLNALTELVEKLFEEANGMSSAMRSMEHKSLQMSNMVNEVSKIAKQTNMLSLNATLEAAKAGTAGKGFAVVATAVKKLATQSAETTRHISDHVRSIQHDTVEAVDNLNIVMELLEKINEIHQTLGRQESHI